MPSDGRAVARKLWPVLAGCEWPDGCADAATDRHHKDGNIDNNVRENVEFLCDSHHHARHSTLSDEAKAKISAALSGRLLSEQHRSRIGDLHRGKPKSDDHRRKLSDALKGRPAPKPPRTLEHTENLAKALRGKKYGHQSEERRNKIGVALKAAWARRKKEQTDG